MKTYSVIFAACLIAAPTSSLAAGFVDDFSRPDGTNMGPKWAEVEGGFRIFGNRAYAEVNSEDNLMLATSFPTTNPVITLDVAYGSGLATASLYARFVDSSNNIQVKLVDTNGDLGFDHVYLLYGDTGQGWPGMIGGPADFAITPTTHANVRLNLRHDVLELTVSLAGFGPGNFPDGPGTEKFVRGGVPQSGLVGAQYGLGGSPAISFDNVVVRAPEPGSACLALLAAPFLRRRRRASKAAGLRGGFSAKSWGVRVWSDAATVGLLRRSSRIRVSERLGNREQCVRNRGGRARKLHFLAAARSIAA